MSRSAKIRAAVQRVADEADVRIDADYEQRGRVGEWWLRWSDGPTVAALTAMVETEARGYVTAEVRGGLRYSREETPQALAAALAQRVLDGEQPRAYEVFRIAAETSFPGGVSPRARELGDFALVRAGLDPERARHSEVDPALDYLADTGRDALAVDFWLATAGAHPGCSPHLPEFDLDTPAARAAVVELYRVLQQQLVGRSGHAGDPRARQLAAQTIRHAVPAMLADCQRADAAAALVDGWSMRSLGRAVGLGDRTLSASLGTLDEQVRTMTWLHERAGEWTEACRAAGVAVRQAMLYAMPADMERDTEILRSAGGGHRALFDTVPAARRLTADRRVWGRSTGEALTAVSDLLADLDRAEPPTPRERHSRKGNPAPAT